MRRVAVCAATVLLGGCGFSSDSFYQTSDSKRVQFYADTPHFRAVVNEFQKAVTRETTLLWRHSPPELFHMPTPMRHQMLNELAKGEVFEVPAGSYCRWLQSSEVPCNASPISSSAFYKFRVTAGAVSGKEGWACWGDDVKPTLAWP